MTYSKTPDSLALRFCYFAALLVHGQINQDRTIRPTLCHRVHGHATAKQLDNSATYVRWQRGTARIHSAAVRRYDTIRDAIFTCAQKLTRVSLMYRTEPSTKKWGKEKKLKSQNGLARKCR